MRREERGAQLVQRVQRVRRLVRVRRVRPWRHLLAAQLLQAALA
jgi:hypothetical protein